MFIRQSYGYTRQSAIKLPAAPLGVDTTIPEPFTVPLGKYRQDNSSASLLSPYKIHLPDKFMAVSAQIVYGTGDTINVPMVARVSVADYRGNMLLDTLVRPTQEVTDHRTAQTGLVAAHFVNAPSFAEVRHLVINLVQDKIIVGHCIWQFLFVLGLRHPAIDTRDVASFLTFRRVLGCGSTVPPLHVLSHRLMGRPMGAGHEHPLENARAALDLYRSAEHVWEEAIDSGSWPCALPPVEYAEYFL
ncbi:hypothetical protein BC834DRAFT_450707 [Gloeopeniophorella convolvens]|nr:hypothetical protein BC834DRAFT_450707 [Gloeopeniophorella convolvens]